MSTINLADSTDSFDFIISPEPRRTTIDVSKGNYVEIAFVVRNVSGRTVRAEALINPLLDSSELANPPLSPNLWAQYLHILNPNEWEFEHGAVRTYTVRLELPDLFPSGSYRFQLLIVGTDDPDNQIVESDEVTFTVGGPALNVRPYLLATIALLAVIILLGVGAALYLKPKAQLMVQFKPPKEMEVGKVAPLNVVITNMRQEPLQNVVMDYTLPSGLIGASAFVPNSPLRNCDRNSTNLHCDLGTLAPGMSVTVTIEALPGPVGGIIKYVKSMTVSSLLNGQRSVQTVDLKQQTSTVNPASQDVSIAIDPGQSVALTGEVLRYNILAWSNSALTDSYTITYTLPQGLTYQDPLPSNCKQQTEPSDYFILKCTGKFTGKVGDIQRIALQAVASSPSQKLVHHAVLQLDTNASTGDVKEFKADDVTTSAVSTALMFNGADDWVELGFNKGLPTFTAEMWVHPFSTDDGQAFIGAHRQASTNVDNMFLVGYYSDGLSVEINGEYHNLEWTKIADRFHLAIVVEQLQADTWQAIVYINGVPQPWREPEDTGVCRAAGSSTDNCKLFKTPTSETRMDGAPTMPWVLGQDWDQGLRGPKTSDFLYGSLAEVSLWNTVRTQDQIQAEMNQRPHGDEAGLVGYWRLEPVDLSSNTLTDRASGQYPGTRINANWNDITPRYGTALKFNGYNDVLSADNLHFSDLKTGPDGSVELTMAGWFYVDGIPTRQQWLLGNMGTPQNSVDFTGTVSPPNNSSSTRDPFTCAAIDSGNSASSAAAGTPPANPPNIWAGLILTEDGHVAVVARSESSKWTIYKDERSIPVGRWVHFAGVIVYNAANNQIDCMTLIRNGSWIPSLNMSNSQQNGVDHIRVDTVECPNHFYIGGLCTDYFFNGKIDDVRIWNRVVEPSEIDVWRKLPGIVFDEVAYWSFDDILGGVRPEGCALTQVCDRSQDGLYNLNINGPEWVPADPNLLPVAPSR